MIKSDREYSISRYWRDIFQRDARNCRDFEQNAMELLLSESYYSMATELADEMEVYRTKTEKSDEEFPVWKPEDVIP